MKHIYTFILCTLFSFQLSAQRNCGTMDYLAHQLEIYPEYQKNIDELEKFTRNFVLENRELNGGIVTIPVVVHVVYSNSTQNISDSQVNSQIDVLNDDFRRLNNDATNTPPEFQGVASDTEIEFCLTHITRTPTSVGNFGTNDAVKFSSSGGKDVESPNQNLNIWICSIGGGILGYAQFPGGPASTDGVVLDYRYTGTLGTATYPFHLGRTGTHEVGHWLNLRHIWGDGGCNVDDSVSDTPLAGSPNFTGSPCAFPGPNSCKPKGKPGQPDDYDMFQNYMDYSDDECMNLYTDGQKIRMWAALNGSRSSFLQAACDGTPPPPSEICDNNLDDDDDGLIDCNDPDCSGDPACVEPGVCDAPTGLTHSRRKGGQEGLLEWNAVPGAISYFVEVYNSAGQLHASGTVTSNGAIVSGLTKNQPYTWQVRTNCVSGQSGWATGAFTAKVNLNDTFAEDRLHVSPNPGNALITIEWDLDDSPIIKEVSSYYIEYSEALSTIELMSLDGTIINSNQNLNVNSFQMDVSDIQQGVYILRVRDSKGQYASIKFVKI